MARIEWVQRIMGGPADWCGAERVWEAFAISERKRAPKEPRRQFHLDRYEYWCNVRKEWSAGRCEHAVTFMCGALPASVAGNE